MERVDAHDVDAAAADAEDVRKADEAETERRWKYEQALNLVRSALDYARNLK